MSFCHRRNVSGLCLVYTVNSSLNHCLSSELPSAPTRFRHTRPAAAANPLEFQVYRGVERPNLQEFPAGPGSYMETSLHCV